MKEDHSQTEMHRYLREAASSVAKYRAENAALKERLAKLETALAPRLSNLLSMRPLRFVLRERNRIKAGGAPFPADGFAGSDEIAPKDIVAKVKAEAGNATSDSIAPPAELGIAVFTHNRPYSVSHVLEALARQNALSATEVWIDGDQGNLFKRVQVDRVEECVTSYEPKSIHRNRGQFGFRKMILTALHDMMQRYEKLIILEDDCFPTGVAISTFNAALDRIECDDGLFSVYGHPFTIENEQKGSARFQGWGWATTAKKMDLLWPSLIECYWKTERNYIEFVSNVLTPEIEAILNVTPGRQPTDTLRHFFAWDETLGLLAALRGMKHVPTIERTIYNFGASESASHFSGTDPFRKPPFNMVSMDEIWDRY